MTAVSRSAAFSCPTRASSARIGDPVRPCRTSACRSRLTISSGLQRFLAIVGPPHSQARGRTNSSGENQGQAITGRNPLTTNFPSQFVRSPQRRESMTLTLVSLYSPARIRPSQRALTRKSTDKVPPDPPRRACRRTHFPLQQALPLPLPKPPSRSDFSCRVSLVSKCGTDSFAEFDGLLARVSLGFRSFQITALAAHPLDLRDGTVGFGPVPLSPRVVVVHGHAVHHRQ